MFEGEESFIYEWDRTNVLEHSMFDICVQLRGKLSVTVILKVH